MPSRNENHHVSKGRRKIDPGQMSRLQKDLDEERIIGILLADVHLTLRPPIWRSAEPDWLGAQRRPWNEIKALQTHFGNVPIICAGDIFDRWDSPAELINWAAETLPQMYAIPGQHDLPLHQYEDLKKSAYYSLIKMDVVQNILPGCIVDVDGISISGFPHGVELKPPHEINEAKINLAVVHDYLYISGCSHPKADPRNKLSNKLNMKRDERNRVFGFDVIMYGDNHIAFTAECGITTIFNCGTLMRRKLDEENYNPWVGLLDDAGVVHPYDLDTAPDKSIDVPEAEAEGEFDIKGLMRGLEELGDTALDFVDAMMEYMRNRKLSKGAKLLILEAMGKAK